MNTIKNRLKKASPSRPNYSILVREIDRITDDLEKAYAKLSGNRLDTFVEDFQKDDLCHKDYYDMNGEFLKDSLISVATKVNDCIKKLNGISEDIEIIAHDNINE